MFSAVSFTFYSIWWQFPPFEFRSISWQGSFSLRFKPRVNGRNILGQKLPTLLDASCFVRLHSLLHVVVCCYWELLHPFAHYCQHGSNNPQYCWLLRPFAHSFTGDSGVKTTLEGLLVLHYLGLSDWQSNPRFAKLHRMTRYDRTPPTNPWRLWEAGTVPYCDDVPVKKKTTWSLQLNQFIYTELQKFTIFAFKSRPHESRHFWNIFLYESFFPLFTRNQWIRSFFSSLFV